MQTSLYSALLLHLYMQCSKFLKTLQKKMNILTSFILPAGVLLLSAMNDVAAQSADPTPLERRRLGLAPCSRSVSTACQRNQQNFHQTHFGNCNRNSAIRKYKYCNKGLQYYGYNKKQITKLNKLALIV